MAARKYWCHMATESGAELSFTLPADIDLVLPQLGQVTIRPYVSGRAMDVYFSRAGDPKSAFQQMASASVAWTAGEFPSLSEEDLARRSRNQIKVAALW
jgi:hypothetical protein